MQWNLKNTNITICGSYIKAKKKVKNNTTKKKEMVNAQRAAIEL